MIYAKVSDVGDVICPSCSCNIVTPKGYNPYSLCVERMILIPETLAHCPFCKKSFQVNEEEAERHNAYWLKKDTHAEGQTAKEKK